MACPLLDPIRRRCLRGRRGTILLRRLVSLRRRHRFRRFGHHQARSPLSALKYRTDQVYWRRRHGGVSGFLCASPQLIWIPSDRPATDEASNRPYLIAATPA